MANLSDSSPSADIVTATLFVVARLEADPALMHMAPLPQASCDTLLQALGARNKAENARVKQAAKVAYARDRMLDELASFALHAAAHLGGKDSPVYKRVLPITPLAFVALPKKDLPGKMDDVEKALRHTDTPDAVRKQASTLMKTKVLWEGEAKALKAAVEVQQGATDAIQKAKVGCLVALAATRGQLVTLFPRQPKKVARQFPETKRAGKVDPVGEQGPVTGAKGPKDSDKGEKKGQPAPVVADGERELEPG